jgi:hypothetical protein
MENVTTQVAEITNEIQLINIEDKITLKLLAEKLNEVITKLNASSPQATRNRGPQSERTMTEDDARRIMLGDLKEASHKDAAEQLGLSYGQIYSARKGFTFKVIYQEMIKGEKAK